MSLEIIPIPIQREIEKGDNLVSILLSTKQKIEDGDIIVFSQKIISKQEGRLVNLDNVIPSILAQGLGSEYEKEPNLVEVILSETKRIVRMENEILIVETKNDIVCANAGVDESNVSENFVTLLPLDPDGTAAKLQNSLQEKTKKKVSIIISDTFGRPFRLGQVNQAIGIAGIEPISDYQGKKDNFGKTLRITAIAIADEISSATELVMEKTKNCPIAIVRNYQYIPSGGTAKKLIRPRKEDLFR